MKSMDIGNRDLEIDLAFNAFPNVCSLTAVDRFTKLRLTEEELWHQEIMTWVQIIRSDLKMICPTIVRDTSTLSLGLQFTDDFEIAELNAIWREKPESTDVLSFSVLDESMTIPTNKCVEIGDIVVSVPTAQRQARLMKHGLVMELRWLVSHGLLHLLGWDHSDEASLNAMLSCQKQLIDITGNLQHRGDEIQEITDAS